MFKIDKKPYGNLYNSSNKKFFKKFMSTFSNLRHYYMKNKIYSRKAGGVNE